MGKKIGKKIGRNDANIARKGNIGVDIPYLNDRQKHDLGNTLSH